MTNFTPNELLSNSYKTIRNIFDEDVYTLTLRSLRLKYNRLEDKKKGNVLDECDRLLKLGDIAAPENEKIRVSLLKVMVAAFPDSIKLFDFLIKKRYTRNDHELLFTFFCYVDKLLYMPRSGPLCERILLFTKEFLLHVKADRGKAAWMAGDLLGAHWRLRQSLPVLMEVSQRGCYAAGREAAVNGLGESLKRITSEHIKNRIYILLHQIETNDKSKNVRLSARLIRDRFRVN